jgi:hypothetical protein
VAFFGCGGVAGVAATLGVARRCGLVDALNERLDGVALLGLRFGLMGLAALVACSATLLLLGMMLSSSAVGALFAHTGPQPGNATGMLLLCVGYLPNAVVAALCYLLGPGLSVGAVTVSPVRFVGGPLPDVPLFAAFPERPSGWAPLVLVVPAAVGALVGWRCRRVARGPLARLRTVTIAAAVVAAGGFLLAAVSGGRLGAGPFDPVSLPAGLLALVAFGWVAVPGALVAWLAGPRSNRRRVSTRNRSVQGGATDEQEPDALVLDESAVEDALAGPTHRGSGAPAQPTSDAAPGTETAADADAVEENPESDEAGDSHPAPGPGADPVGADPDELAEIDVPDPEDLAEIDVPDPEDLAEIDVPDPGEADSDGTAGGRGSGAS